MLCCDRASETPREGHFAHFTGDNGRKAPACAQRKATLNGGCGEPQWWRPALGAPAPHMRLSVLGEEQSGMQWGHPRPARNFRVELQVS